MKRWATLDAQGCARRIYEGPQDMPEGAVSLAPGFDPAGMRWKDGAWAPRERVLAPVRTATGVSVSDLPDGCVVEVTDVEAAMLLATVYPEAGAASIDLPDAGLYRVTVDAPSPWLPSSLDVEVS